MATYTIEIEETLPVPRKQVFALFADHQRFGAMLGAPIKRIKDSGQSDPNGLGSIRKIGFGPIGFEETIVCFEPDDLIEYAITSKAPIRAHHGRIHFADAGDGQTQLHYTISFNDVLPFSGALIKPLLENAIRKGIRRVPSLV